VTVAARVIVFDLDDTLYPESAYVESGFRAAADEVGKRADGRGAAFLDACLRLFRAGTRDRVLDRALVELELVDRVPAADLIEAYRYHVPAIDLPRESVKILGDLKQRGKQLGLITDGEPKRQWGKIDALGIRAYFDAIVVTHELGPEYGKPHPFAFERVMQKTAASGADLAYVADNVAKDFLAPNRLGWTTIQLARAGGVYAGVVPPTPDHAAKIRIESLADLEHLLENHAP
jgi:putative hydrolase of the HAD superfamily